jgi:hypothetical protein
MSAREQDDINMKDVIDLLSHASHEKIEKIDENDRPYIDSSVDHEHYYWGTRMVNTQHLGEAVVKFKRLEQKANEAKYFMTAGRAKVAREYIMALYMQYKYGIDSKSSETSRDKDNNQSSLLHLIRKQTVEKEFTAKNDKTRKLLSGFLQQKDPDEA